MRVHFHRFPATFALLTTALLLGACSELKQDLPAPMAPQGIHETGWNDPASPAFHGTVLSGPQYENTDCVSCHSKAYSGGTSGVSCYGCHTSYPHKPGWVDTAATTFHGKFLRLDMGTLDDCAACHGADFSGGTSGVSCYTCHASYPHRTGWGNPASTASHGRYLKGKNWQLTECAACHGENYTGGTSGVSCFTCHASYPHTVFQASSGHPGYLLSKGYPLAQCKTCHGASYTGGPVVNVSCSTVPCHADAGGTPKSPEACNTCHGQFRAASGDALSAAPPKTVLGDSQDNPPVVHAIGAHQKHLVSGNLGKSVKCAECHLVPAQTFPPGHVDTQLPAEVVFRDTLARLATGTGGNYLPVPAYGTTTFRCSNTYCHGAWRLSRATSSFSFAFTDSVMAGTNFAPSWNGGSTDGACGSCHGLPPAGHTSATLTSCVNCHPGVVNGSGNIIDKTKHINGKVNAFNTERSF